MNTIKAFLYRVSQNPLVMRAAHTFIQAFLAVLLVTGLKLDKTTLIAAVAAGISAVKTLVLQLLEAKRS